MLKNILNDGNARKINKSDQKNINGGGLEGCLQPSKCYGSAYLIDPNITQSCDPGYRLIGHCICCMDQYVC